MKKRIAYSLASVVAASAIGFSGMPIYAQTTPTQTTVVQTKEIKDPQDFVDLYCSLKKVTIDTKKQEIVSYTVYETVTEKNYEQILSGKKVYDILSKDMQKAVNEILWNTKNPEGKLLEKDYTKLYEEALLMQQTVKEKEEVKPEESEEITKPEQEASENKPPVTEESTSSQEPEKTTEDNKEAEENKETETTEVSKPETEENVQDETESRPEEEKEPVENEAFEEIEAPVIAPSMFLYKAEPTEESLLVSATQAAPKTVEPQVVTPVVQETKPVVSETKETVKPVVSNTLELNTLDPDVQNFIKNYLMDANGNLYTSVTMYNYRQILSGVAGYSDLSTDKVSQLNSYLLANGSQRYFSLVNQCQRIENQGSTLTKRPVVDTSTSSGFGLYGVLMALSSVGFGFLIKRKKEKNL
ncbi:hypothetical protein ACR75P_09645 [Faecalicoccus pleomorphus]|uniref:hypothetical protein n=1 Tax=Faecalicoccus pleomorphus TaxID=1323 RepID=UPI003DA5E3A6